MTGFQRCKGIQIRFFSFKGKDACKSDRSRQELSNEYFLFTQYLVSNIGFGTGENESLKVCQ